MSIFQSKARSISNDEASIKNRNIGNGFGNVGKQINGEVAWQDNSSPSPINQANTIKLTNVCKHYGIEIGEFNKNIQCPFPFHNDNGPSFYYYPNTNSFFCWGCKNGGGPVIFISLLESISKLEAANKLLGSFESEEIESQLFNKASEKNDLYLYFSSTVRDFIKKDSSTKAIEFIDKITLSFDTITQKHSVDNSGLKLLIDKLVVKIKNY